MSGRIVTPQKIQAVLAALTEGKTRKEISRTLHIGNKTIAKIITGECVAKESRMEEQKVWEEEFKKDWVDVCSRITGRKRQ